MSYSQCNFISNLLFYETETFRRACYSRNLVAEIHLPIHSLTHKDICFKYYCQIKYINVVRLTKKNEKESVTNRLTYNMSNPDYPYSIFKVVLTHLLLEDLKDKQKQSLQSITETLPVCWMIKNHQFKGLP